MAKWKAGSEHVRFNTNVLRCGRSSKSKGALALGGIYVERRFKSSSPATAVPQTQYSRLYIVPV